MLKRLLRSYRITKKIKTCKNDCIFCFIKQLPAGLRPSLYVRDDDYLLSYMYGNFITLTDVKREDLNRIVKYKLEPLYISVHSLDGNTREVLFGNNRSMAGIENLRFLDKSGIKSNIQIVLCPGINDGEDLEGTLFALIKEFKNVISVGIVPVGITKFNRENRLKPYGKKSSVKIIDFLKRFKSKYKKFKKTATIYLSDEFYLIAGTELPDYKYYRDFYQIENGIGKSTYFLKKVKDYMRNNFDGDKTAGEQAKNNGFILLLTSEYGEIVIREALDVIIEKYTDYGNHTVPSVKILKIKNIFLGGNIRITGLMSGEDIMLNLKKKKLEIYDKILIPDCIFNDDGLTIDDYTKQDIKNIDKRIKIIPDDGHSFAEGICLNNIRKGNHEEEYR
jgi:putative radical SAM enzyme (TIGR03279 family)